MTLDALNELETAGLSTREDTDPALWPDPDDGELEAMMLGPSRLARVRLKELAW